MINTVSDTLPISHVLCYHSAHIPLILHHIQSLCSFCFIYYFNSNHCFSLITHFAFGSSFLVFHFFFSLFHFCLFCFCCIATLTLLLLLCLFHVLILSSLSHFIFCFMFSFCFCLFCFCSLCYCFCCFQFVLVSNLFLLFL